MGGAWIEGALQEEVENFAEAKVFICNASAVGGWVVHAGIYTKEGAQPMCKWKKGANKPVQFNGTFLSAPTVEEAEAQFGGEFCDDCFWNLPASKQVKIRELFKK